MSLQPINIIGLGPNDPPGVYLQVQFAQGQPSLGNSKYAAVILANINESVGTAQVDGYVYGPDTLIGMSSTTDAIELFGAGSPAHRMVKAFIKVNPNTPLYVAPVKKSVGSAATFVINITGTATSSGTVRCNIVSDTPVDTGFITGDSPTVIATAMKANINAQQDLPVTADNTAGVLTLTAKVPGARSNWLRASARVLSGTGVASDRAKMSYFTGGTTADSYTNVLNYLATNGARYYYYITEAGCDSVDATQFEAVQAHIDTLAQPTIGLRQRAVAGSCDTLANTETTTGVVNDARAECVWLQNSDVTPSELATNAAAAYALFEVPPLSAGGVNFDGFGNDATSSNYWKVAAPLDGSAPSVASLKSAVLSGITALKVQQGGRTSIVKRITTRFKSGAVNDFRITDSGKVTICDYFSDDLINLLVLRYPRKLIASDPVQGQPPAGPNVVTPSQVRNTVIELINVYASAGLIDGSAVISGLVVQREVSPSSRIGIRVPLFTNDPLHTFGISVDQVS